MFFPNLKEIATKDVIVVGCSASLDDAARLMDKNDIRDIVVADDGKYKIITANVLIRCSIEKIDFRTELGTINLKTIPTFKSDTNVLDALTHTTDEDYYVCILESNLLVGIVTHADIISSIDPETILKKQKLKEILKLHRPQTAELDTPLIDILPMLERNTHESVIILKEHKPVGILTTKDIVSVFSTHQDIYAPVSNYMTTPLQTVYQKTTIKEAIDYVKKKNFSRIIVVDEDESLLGVVTQKELIAFSYNRWSEILKTHEKGLIKINRVLEKKTKTLELLATTDMLTGIYNRSKFNELIEAEISRKNRYNTQLCIIILDIDNFKIFNDTYGHLIGDEVLRCVAKVMLKHVRKTDIAARWGGEEFVIIIPHVDLDSAVHVAQKIRKGIEEYKFDNIEKITASFGVAEANKNDNKDSLLHRADQALYFAKESGRNKVSTENDLKDK